jgi:Peptidase M15
MAKQLFDFAAVQSYSIKSLNEAQARRIQSLLKGAGYPVVNDGIIGPKTIEQFARFKEDNYLEHPLDLGITTYNELITESNERQRPLKPSDETSPILIPNRKNVKAVVVNGFGKVYVTTRIAGDFTWGHATHDGTRPVHDASHAENIRILATRLNEFQKFVGASKPFRITSWYRPEPWNSRAGGATRSQHLYGKAVDLICASLVTN